MGDTGLTDEHRNVLEILRDQPRSRLRDIHDELAARDESGFEYSPDFGDGWNEERRAVRELKDELANRALITNDYQQWYLTKDGRELLD